jgi:hypothetical protein
MWLTRPAHDVRFAGFGVLTPAGIGTAPLCTLRVTAPARRTVPVGPADLCGDAPESFRRADRYGVLGYAAAGLAMLDAEPAEPARSGAPESGAGPAAGAGIDTACGVMIGSSVACWSANRRFHEERRDRPAASLSPALFVRTVANAVNGDLSIARGLAGPCETFVSGFTAGAEALIAAAVAIDAGRARVMLAGGVEAPEGFFETPRSEDPVEAAGFALLRRGAAPASGRDADPGVRLLGWHRSHDPCGRFRLAAALDALQPIGIDAILVANRVPEEIMTRWRADAEDRPLFALADRIGEPGAAGVPLAVALARARHTARLGPTRLVLGRDPAGGLAALVVQA